MLDIKFVRENPDAVRENIKKKFQDEKLPLVDEAIDYDARLRAAIRARQGGQTVFIVSQRASGVRYADRILVMDEGRVSAQGTHEELMQSSALYREIYFSQFPEGDHVCESR